MWFLAGSTILAGFVVLWICGFDGFAGSGLGLFRDDAAAEADVARVEDSGLAGGGAFDGLREVKPGRQLKIFRARRHARPPLRGPRVFVLGRNLRRSLKI